VIDRRATLWFIDARGDMKIPSTRGVQSDELTLQLVTDAFGVADRPP